MKPSDVELRPLSATDWESVHSWGNLPETSRYQAWGPNTVQQSREFAQQAETAWGMRPQTRFVYIAQNETGIVGSAELRIHSRRDAQGEIQYLVHPRLWGRGLATSIGRQLLRIGFAEHQLHRVFATCDPRNRASEAVLRKLGMTYEGKLRQAVKLDTEWRDSTVYSILAPEWPNDHT